MRRLIIGLFVVSLALGGGLPLPASSAQPRPAVTMRLISQPAWNDGSAPLELSIRATNDSDVTLESLKVVLIIHAPARSRSLYELSLTSDATGVLLASPFLQPDALAPGRSREFTIRQSLEVLQGLGETVIYPLSIELTSADTPVGTLRSPLVFLSERPEVPLNLAWTWVLSAPVEYRPDGVFLPGTLEADLARGGRLESLATALEGAQEERLDLVVSWALADQLERMASGYRILEPSGGIRTVAEGAGGAADAASLLSRLRALAERRGVEVVAHPLGDPRLPSLVGAGLANDLGLLHERGRAALESALGKAPSGPVFRPPLSQLDAPSLSRLEGMGARTLLLDESFLPPPQGLMFSPPAVVRLTSPMTSMSAVVPDAQVTAVAASLQVDPELAAHAALGELAATWLELPGTPGRGAALLFPENPALSVPVLRRFAELVRRSPWLRPVTVSRFVDLVAEQGDRPLPSRRYPAVSDDYLGRLFRAKSSLSRFDRTAVGARPLTDSLRNRLLLAEGGMSVSEPLLGRTFIESVDAAIGKIYEGVTIEPSRLTLASQSGTIPITLSNRSGFRMNVLLKFSADRRLQFVDGSSHRLTLPVSTRTLTFAVRAQTTGHIPFTIRLVTPGGPAEGDTIAEATMVIRSTAYSRVALIFTVGAALFLLVWWGRRFLPRRTG